MSDRHRSALPTSTVGLLAIVAGGAIANNYAIQPSIGAIARDLHATQETISFTISGLMFGYLSGLALFVPLTDRINPRRLVPLQLFVLAGALVAASFATSAWLLFACLVLVGMMATVAAQMSAIVGKLASPADRGRQMGLISAGISAGILLSRFVGGSLTTWLGWRGMLLCFAMLSSLAAIAAWATLPSVRPQAAKKNLVALHSVRELLAEFPDLRSAGAAGMLWFAAFSAIWVGLAIELAQSPWLLSAEAIGFYSLAGALGLVVTPIAGSMTDRFGPRRVKLAGLAVAAVATMALGLTLGKPTGLMLALGIFDAGCFAAQVANQSAIVRLAPDRSGALMSTYLLLYYVAGAIGTAAAGPLVSLGGWDHLVATAAVAIIGAIILSAKPRSD